MRVLAPALACLMLAALAPGASAATKFRPRVRGAMGLYPTVNSSGRFGTADIATGALTPVTYHGGSVMAGGVHIHTIFWAPAGFSFQGQPAGAPADYTGMLERFFTDSVADNGSASNMFSVLPQFAQGTIGGPITPGAYSLSYNAADTTHDAITDTDPYPALADQCASPNNIPTCITDAQVQAEVDHVITATGGTRDLHNLWMVFLPPNVDECILPGVCGTNAFGGYHSLSNLGNGTAIYALIIDPLIEAVIHQGADPQGYPDAETTIDIAAHETEEAMTDPEGIGYMDPNGFESADKCEFGPQEGTPLGFAPNGSPYNELINGHQYLIQEMWSNNDTGCVQRTSLNGNPLPLPQVNLTQYSRVVSGNIGSAHAVSVHVALIRAGQDGGPVTVASNSTISSASDGSWSVTLQRPVGDDRDEIDIDYGGAGAPQNDVILTGNGGDPYNEAGWTGWTALDQGSNLTNVGGSSLSLAPCFQTGVLTATLNGAPIMGPHGEIPTDFCSTQTDVATIPTPATGRASVVTASTNDNRAFGPPNLPTPPNPKGALVKLTVPVGEPDAVSTILNQLPTFTQSGLATCGADLEARQVFCSGLVPGQRYTLIDGAARASGAADAAGQVSASLPVKRGQSVSLSNGSRTLTTLHVANLRADIVNSQTVLSGGSCQPDQYMAPPLTTPPTNSSAGAPSAFAGGAALTGEICPGNGRAAGFGIGDLTQTDEASGGFTTTEVPDVQDTSPINAEIVYGGFTAVATSGLSGPDNSVIPTDSTSRISLAIAKASGGGVVFRAANVDTANGVKVKALKPGTYRALWTLTDANGDRRLVVTRFVEEAAQGSNPAPKPRVSCRIVNHKVKCTVIVPKAQDVSGTLRMKLVRDGQVAALGHGRISHGQATVTLRELRKTTRGSWTATVVIGGTSTRMGVRVS